MDKDANYFVVGVFVSLALLAFVGFAIWLVGSNGISHETRYTVYFTDPVGGLAVDGDVKYQGVEAGKILAIRLTPGHDELVKVDIGVTKETPVSTDTQAKIEMQGITGQSYIELTTPNGGKPPPTVADERYPVLKGSGSQIAKFLDDLPKVSHQLQSTLSAVTDLSHDATRTSESIRGFVDQIKENPAQVLHGPSQKGVVIPK